MTKITSALALGLLAALVLPVQALAAEAAGGLALDPIIAVVAALVGVLVALSKYMPGWGTNINIVVGALTAIVAALTDMAHTSPTATVSAILMSSLGALIGRARTGQRAAGRSVLSPG